LPRGLYSAGRLPHTAPDPSPQKAKDGEWRDCTISRVDALRLAELIYLSLDQDLERIEHKLELVAARLIVFLSG
jgi:hypothetical protein